MTTTPTGPFTTLSIVFDSSENAYLWLEAMEALRQIDKLLRASSAEPSG
jgi:hypothetical protein